MRKTSIPSAALWLGIAGLLPFLWGALTSHNDALADWGLWALGPRLTGIPLVLGYGVIILAFMSGVLWGFAARAPEPASLYYALSVMPALWALFTVGGDLNASLRFLALGYIGLFGLDVLFAMRRFAPDWWLQLRLLLTMVVLACLATTALA
jgi:hypothetical protein